jgi:hypothetical protein
MFTITATMQTETAELKDDTLQQMVKYMDGAHREFELAALKVHRKTVFEILIALIRYTPVDTGRLRGSWTPYLDRHGKSAAYSRFMGDSSLAIGDRGGAARLDAAAISQGKREGFFTDGTLITTVGSNVAYAYAVNEYSRYFDRAAIDANRIINKNFEEFLKASREAGWIPPRYSDEPKPES